MNHVLAVGTVTDAAKAIVERADGRIWYVSDMPSVALVQLPYPRFEHEHNESYVIRIKLDGGSLLWSGDYDGPELTSVDKTMLKAEYGEPVEPTTSELETLPDIDDMPF